MITPRKQTKLITSILLLLLVYCSICYGQNARESASLLRFSASSQNSESIAAQLELTANAATLQLIAGIKLINIGSKPIEVTGITVNTEGGLQSYPAKGNIKPFTINPGKEVFITNEFQPVNDIKVYQLTGKQGHIKAQYKVSVFYKIQPADRVYTTTFAAQLPADTYNAYMHKYGTLYTGYAFNTASNFDQTERKYLEKLNLKSSLFAFVAQHEIALTGSNIWLTSYLAKDTLYADLLIVNHDDYTIKIVPDSLNLGHKGDAINDKTKKIVIEKIIGAQRNKDLIENGGKVIIHFKKYFKGADLPVTLFFNHAFLIKGATPLFKENIGLNKVQLQ